jgi:hypothetical protein
MENWHNYSIGEKIIAVILILAIAFGIICFGSWIVMLLWNATLSAIFGISTISFWQAMGIKLLINFLFGWKFSSHSD